MGVRAHRKGIVEPAELFRLALVALVAPAMIVLVRRLGPVPGRRLFVAAFAVISFSYVVSVAEDVAHQQLFNMLQHASYGVAGVLVLAGALLLRRDASRREDRR
jgi:hypothetical protein